MAVQHRNHLVNTVQDGGGATPQGLEAVVEAHGGPPLRLTETAAEEVREASAVIVGILDIDDEDSAAEAINTLLDQYPARPRLVRLPGRRWSFYPPPVMFSAALQEGCWPPGPA
ncbi:ABATE domain-containing protein (plasmid) [Streptomyces murinus]|uniref:ABATE domain-containing protein n=1 Tax=Streptomyces murinus TaxID=33900 RepID=UPI000A23DE64|nr:ABATE domain-containing protein [Streptomyces murinus]WDO11314.1 ABATE domain-containing protein [Streptomyces murinus]